MIAKAQLKRLYSNRRLSMMEIAQQLRTTHATVLCWLKKHGIQRRSWSESADAKLNPNGDPFSVPVQLTVRQRELLTAGLLLYWAEGCKKGPAAKRYWARYLRLSPSRIMDLILESTLN